MNLVTPKGESRGCGGCGRPVPAPCPYCRTYHCSLHCSLVTTKKRKCPTSRTMKWLRILCCILCVLIVLTLLAILIAAIIFWSNIFGGSTESGTPGKSLTEKMGENRERRMPTKRHYGDGDRSENDDAYADEYYDYKYV